MKVEAFSLQSSTKAEARQYLLRESRLALEPAQALAAQRKSEGAKRKWTGQIKARLRDEAATFS